jgi:proline reductase-associated electron transfer protein PrdC
VEIKIPLRQHVGGINSPIVKLRDKVYKGQLIAVPNGLGANIHSSVSGEIVDIDDENITIKALPNQPDDYIKIKESNDYLELIKEAGVVGAGGAGFPTNIKLNTKLESGFVVVNAAECEPLLNHNMARIMEDPDLIVRGLKYVMEITGAKKGYIAIKPKNKEPLIELGKAIKDYENIEIKYLPNMYPAGDERVIIRELFGIILKPGQLPLEANVVVTNIETIRNIVLAIEERRPVITKDLTVDGRIKSGEKVFLNIPIGTSIKSLIDNCGGYIEPHGEIILGGPFMGKTGSEDSVVTKTTGGILVALPFPNDSRKFGAANVVPK